MNEASLLPSDIKNAALSLYRESRKNAALSLYRECRKNAALSLYRECRKNIPTLPKSRSEAQGAIQSLSLEINKSENFVLVNDKDSEILIFFLRKPIFKQYVIL